MAYPETKVICLEENNRSTQTILDLSYSIIQKILQGWKLTAILKI
jgi:superfamily I DNA/RNA helicase